MEFSEVVRTTFSAREFTNDVASPEGSALLAGIVQLGRSLRLETIAEGIEKPDQRDRIAAAGCDLGQGFLFARPMPAGEVAPLLEPKVIVPTGRGSAAPSATAGYAAIDRP